jgi:hypothetical protein
VRYISEIIRKSGEVTDRKRNEQKGENTEKYTMRSFKKQTEKQKERCIKERS